MTDIQIYTNEVAQLARTVSWWNTAQLGFMVVAAVAAVGAFIAQNQLVNRSELLANAQERLGGAKEAQMLLELKEKDAQIAKAHAQAAEANAEAAKANARIAEMNRVRRLTKPQAEALKMFFDSGTFKRDGGTLRLRVGCVPDVEAEAFAWDIQKFLESCGVNIYPTKAGSPIKFSQRAESPHGLEMLVKSISKPVPAFVELERLLLAVGLPLVLSLDAQMQDDEAILVVTKKPV